MFRPTVLAAAWFAFAPSAPAGGVPPRPASVIAEQLPKATSVPVLVEMFTSQGCVECPSADAALRELEGPRSVPGAEVIVLDEHLDFDSGFREPQSARAMTNRQIDYGRLFRNDNIFEPQIIVGGRTQLLGRETARLREEIAREAKSAKIAVEVTFQSASVATVKIARLPDDAPPCDVWMAVTETNLESAPDDVQPGAARTATPHTAMPHTAMPHTGVVRSLVLLGRVDPSGPASYSMHLRFNPRWKRDDLKYVVFVQDRLSRRIWGATAVAP